MKQDVLESRVKQIIGEISVLNDALNNMVASWDGIEENNPFELPSGSDVYANSHMLEKAIADIKSLIIDMYYDQELMKSKFVFTNKPYLE